MFENVGAKLKTMAMVSCCVGILGAICAGIAMIGETPGLALLVIVVGSFSAWISALVIYGLGICTEKAEHGAGESVQAAPLPTDVMRFLRKQKEQDEQAEAEKKEEEKKRQEERKQALLNKPEGDWAQSFLEQAATCTRMKEIRDLWETIPHEDCETAAEVEKVISEYIQIERMYGLNSMNRVIERIRELL